MNKPAAVILALATLLAACAPTVYGVPQESWDRMAEAERRETIRVYEQDQQARRQAEQERAWREAQDRARQESLERERHDRIEAIHHGSGAYGELIQVRLQGGSVRIGDRHYRHEALTFTIADGETRKITLIDEKRRETTLPVAYNKGILSIESLRFPYERSWGRGMLYSSAHAKGAVELKDLDVAITVHDRSTRFERQQLRMAIMRDESPPEKPARAPRMVEVTLLAGELQQRGQKLKLERTSLRIAEGERREMTVTAGEVTRTVRIAYRKGELVLDGTPDKDHDEIRFPFEKGWQTGKSYRFALKGSDVRLDKVEISIKGIEQK